jgi:hypothetical protein
MEIKIRCLLFEFIDPAPQAIDGILTRRPPTSKEELRGGP